MDVGIERLNKKRLGRGKPRIKRWNPNVESDIKLAERSKQTGDGSKMKM